MGWKDLFSAGAASYARFRPRYPAELFRWLAGVAPGRGLAIDVGAGNAQAARALVEHFDRVIAVEPSAEQIHQAGPPEPGLELRLGAAEALPVDSAGADVILAAQAFHWFRSDDFFAEAARVLRPGGVLALCCYQLTVITPAVDEVVGRLYAAVDRHWEPERRLVEDGYRSVPAPFPELPVPRFEMRMRWTLADLVGYLGTWSALARFRKVEGHDPLVEFVPLLEAAWGPAATEIERDVFWPMPVRAFRRP
jgi:SAM-dependent methyltransferase